MLLAESYHRCLFKILLLTSPLLLYFVFKTIGARCSSKVRAFAHGTMGRQIDPSWGEPIELFYDWCNKGRGMCYPVCGMVLNHMPDAI